MVTKTGVDYADSCRPFLDTGLSLEITPLINSYGLIGMDIHVTVEKLDRKTHIAAEFDAPNIVETHSMAAVPMSERDIIINILLKGRTRPRRCA